MSPTMITVTDSSSPRNSGVSVRKVPAVAGTTCLRTIDPPMASTGMMVKNRPTSIVRPSVVLYHWVLALIPANDEPLLLADDEYEYTISVSPCGPDDNSELVADCNTMATPANASVTSGTASR